MKKQKKETALFRPPPLLRTPRSNFPSKKTFKFTAKSVDKKRTKQQCMLLEAVTEQNQRRHFFPVNFSYYRPAGDALFGRQEAGIGLDATRHLCHLPGMPFHQLSYPLPPAVNKLRVE
jgi:hypothetical protein